MKINFNKIGIFIFTALLLIPLAFFTNCAKFESNQFGISDFGSITDGTPIDENPIGDSQIDENPIDNDPKDPKDPEVPDNMDATPIVCTEGIVNNERRSLVVKSTYNEIPHFDTDELDKHFTSAHGNTDGMPQVFTKMGRVDHFSNGDLFVVSDYLHFYGMMYYLTGAKKYFNYGVKLIDYMFENTDRAQQLKNIFNPTDLNAREGNEPIWTGTFAVLQNRNVAHPGWRHNDDFVTDRFRALYNASSSQKLSTVEVLTDGQVTNGIMHFVDLSLNRNQLTQGERDNLLSYVPKVKVIIDEWQPTWRENITEKSQTYNQNIVITGSYFKIDPATTNGFWKAIGFNQTANLLSAAMLVDKHTPGGVPRYLDMSKKFKDYLLGPELRFISEDKNYPYWPYSSDIAGVSDLDHTTFDIEFLLVAKNNCYIGVTEEDLSGPLNTVRDFAFRSRNTFPEPLFSDLMTGDGGYLVNQNDHVVMGSNWPLLPNAHVKSPVHNKSFHDQIAEMFIWHQANRRNMLYSSKYYRSAAEFLLATEEK